MPRTGEAQSYVVACGIHPYCKGAHNQTIGALSELARLGKVAKGLGQKLGGEYSKLYENCHVLVFKELSPSLDAALELLRSSVIQSGSQASGDNAPISMGCFAADSMDEPSTTGTLSNPEVKKALRVMQAAPAGSVFMGREYSDLAKEYGCLPEGGSIIDLGLHTLRDLGEPERLSRFCLNGDAQQEVQPASLTSLPNNLPFPLPSFIGRRQEMSQMVEIIRGEPGLLTIVGFGGYGKTRLSLQLCAELADYFEHGVFQVQLAPLVSAGQMVDAVAGVLGFQFFGKANPEDQLMDYLRGKELLLYFDNFEHLLDGAGLLGRIGHEAPGARMMVTSREPLKLPGEQVVILSALPVVSEQKDSLPAAVEMLVERVKGVNPGLAIGEQELKVMGRICEKLEGVPLAIELLAAWSGSLTLEDLSYAIEEEIELVDRGGAHPERHRSLQASCDWSYKMLSERQRRILLALTEFRGGFTVAAAEVVLAGLGLLDGAGQAGVGEKVAWERLKELCDKSWLQTRFSGTEQRFFIQDAALHEYLSSKAEMSGEAWNAKLEHARYYSALDALEGPRLRSEHYLAALRTFELEQENINRAWDFLSSILTGQGSPAETPAGAGKQGTCERDNAAKLLLPMAEWLGVYLRMRSNYSRVLVRFRPLADAVQSFPDLHSHLLINLIDAHRVLGNFSSAEELIEGELQTANPSSNKLHFALLLKVKGSLHRSSGRSQDAIVLLKQALQIGCELDDLFLQASCQQSLAVVLSSSGQVDKARKLFKQALAICEEVGDIYYLSIILSNLSRLEMSQGQLTEAQQYMERSNEITQKVGSRYGIALALLNLGGIHIMKGEMDNAHQCYTETLSIARELGLAHLKAVGLHGLASIYTSQDQLDKARENFEQALVICREMGFVRNLASTLDSLAGLELLEGRLDGARDVLTQAEKLSVSQSQIDNLCSVHAKWARYHIAKGREELQSSTREGGFRTVVEIITAASLSLGEAKAFAKQLGVLPVSEIGQGITRARKAIIEFAEEHGLSKNVSDLVAEQSEEDLVKGLPTG